MAGQRETLSFSLPDPNHPVHHLFAREELREEPQDVDSYIESPQPAVTRESPGPHLSSPRQVPETSISNLLSPEPGEFRTPKMKRKDRDRGLQAKKALQAEQSAKIRAHRERLREKLKKKKANDDLHDLKF